MFVFTSYLDESGTHGDSPVTVMGGVLARAQQWKQFNVGFETIRNKYGFRVFHTKRFKSRRGEFSGWTEQKCLNLIMDMAALTETSFTDAVAVSLFDKHYSDFYKSPDTKVRLDSKYGLCFRFALHHLMIEVLRRKYRGKIPPLHVVLESGHPNYRDAERIFFETKKDLNSLGADFLGTITKAAKDESCELMIADFVAHSTFSMQGAVINGQRSLPASDNIPQGTKSIAHLDSTPEALAKVRELTIELAQRAKAKKRLAWEAGSSQRGERSA